MLIEGNVVYDLFVLCFIIIVDCINVDVVNLVEVLILYILYLNNFEIGLFVKMVMIFVEKRGDMRFNGRMICGKIGLFVLILGMIIYFEIGEIILKCCIILN